MSRAGADLPPRPPSLKGREGRSAPAPSFLRALRTVSRRGDHDELLDRPDLPRDLLAQNLAHLRLMNRWLGWSAGLWQEIRPLLAQDGRANVLLDVATGSGDVPRDLARRAGQAGFRLALIGSDISAAVLGDARMQEGPPIALVRHDAVALPFRDNAVDVVTLCLAAHHLDPEALTATFSELWRVARRAVVVSDLERGRAAYLAARLMALALRHPLTSHDGPVSVLRAYTAPELVAIARRAGLTHGHVRRRFPFRMILVAWKESAP
jgi:SAM-dependent methyltransferase